MTKRDIDYKYNWKVYSSLLSEHKPLIGLIFFLIFIFEALKIVDKFLFKYLIDYATEFSEGIMDFSSLKVKLILIAGIFIGTIIFRSIFQWFRLHTFFRLEGNLLRTVKQKFFNHIISLSHAFHTSKKTGSMISRIGRGSRAVEHMTDIMVFNFLPLLFQFIVAATSLAAFDLTPALIIVAIIVVFVAYSIYIHGFQRDAKLIANETEDREKANLADMLTNVDSIKYFGKDQKVKKHFADMTTDTKKAQIKFWDSYRWLDSGQSLIIGIGTFFIMFFTISGFIKGKTSIGTVVFVYSVYATLVPALYGFVRGLRVYYRAMADFESLFGYGKVPNDVEESPKAKNAKLRSGKIEISNITFKYNKRKILKEFSLNIKPHERVALVGHSGCGKSTLVKLLYRFYDPQEGFIKIDGKDVREYKKESLRSELAIVPQECILFDDTIYNNILFSRPNAKRKDVLKAIKFAQLDTIIDLMPEREKTIVGERGVKLSGGEKQRVSIARALLSNKKILVLDEATSALDSQTEFDIQKDLEKLMKGRTSIVIAHRLSTIMNSDRIIVMAKGEIVQMGTHRTLIKKPGQYKKLWNLQKGGYLK